ncbi:DUF4962 domain-containing protein [Fodinibius roseus]|nr:DUF4962 domain-containing protein [Fodinibius roseus]
MDLLNRLEFIKKISALSGLAMGTPFLTVTDAEDLRNGQANLPQRTLDSIQDKLSNIQKSHPSLHFDSKRLTQLRAQAKGTHVRYAQNLFQWVDKNKSWSPSRVTGGSGDEVPLEEAGAFLTNASLAFCLSRKEQHFEIARNWALAMCEYPSGAIRNYGMGIYVAGLARAFDWLYHDFSAEDRDTVKTAVADIVTQMYHNAQPEAENRSWWSNRYIHHDFWIPVGGCGEAALALTGEIKEADKYAAYAKANFDLALTWIGNDGAWHEGAADWCYALAPLLWFYGAWKTVTGEDLHNKPWVRNTANYRLYHWLPNNHYVNLNDSFRSGRYSTSGSASCHLLRRLASIYRDGHAQWLADNDEEFDFKPSPKGVYEAPYEDLSYKPGYNEYPHPKSQTMAWNMLWYDPSVESIPPQMPKTCHFENMGTVMMRTGWGEDAAVVSFACAPLAGHVVKERIDEGEQIHWGNFAHDHADYNSFTLFANGQYFIIPAGYARRASHFQNTVDVNGADFETDPSLNIHIEEFINENNFSYAVGDATEAFFPQLGVKRYKRHILLFENKWLLIFDDLQLNERGSQNKVWNRFNWTVHSDPTTHECVINKNRVKWESLKGNKPPLWMYVIEPREFGWEREMLQSKKGEHMMEALRLSKPEFYGNEKKVLSVWSWENQAEVPQKMDHPECNIVLLGDKKAVGFAKSPSLSVRPSNFLQNGLEGRELLLFGASGNKERSFFRIKDGEFSVG